MNSYELLQILTDGGKSTIYAGQLPDYRVIINPIDCDFGIKKNKHTGKYYLNKNLKMPPQFLVHSLIRRAFDDGRKRGREEKASEIRKTIGF